MTVGVPARTTAGRRGLLAVAAALAAFATAACSGAATGGARAAASPGGAGRSAVPVPASPAAGRALESSAQQLRAQVDTLARGVQGVSAARLTTVDDAGPCEIGAAGSWPQRWGYAVMLTLRGTNATSDANTLRTRLTADGWSVRPYPGTVDSVEFDARKNGVLVRVSGEPNPARVTIEGYGRCITADGTPQKG